MISPSCDDAIFDMPAEGEGPVEVLLRLAATAGAFRSADGSLYAQVPVGDRQEIYGLKSAQFRDWLIDGYRVDCGKLPKNTAIRRVLAALEARARFDGGTPPVFIRVGHDGLGPGDDFSSYLDLGDAGGRAVKIGAGGWSAVDRPGIHFRRPEGLLPLPGPSRDGSIERLLPYVNLNESDFRLLIGWLAAALRPIGPYPILALYGEQGVGQEHPGQDRPDADRSPGLPLAGRTPRSPRPDGHRRQRLAPGVRQYQRDSRLAVG